MSSGPKRTEPRAFVLSPAPQHIEREIAPSRDSKRFAMTALRVTSTPNEQPGTTTRSSRHERARRLFSAWIALIPSKVITLIVQLIAVPAVYRAIGPAQFAAYVAVTASVSLFAFLNLGMGGALVTPLAKAAAEEDRLLESSLFTCTIIPISVIAGVALSIALSLLWNLPVVTIFGAASTATTSAALRTAALLACVGTIAAVPLSVVDNARQAYQEMHISNLFGALSNTVLCAGLLLTAWLTPTLPAIVAVTVLVPLFARVLNAALFLVQRPYLLNMPGTLGAWLLTRTLAADGVSYLGAAAIASILTLQWPVYYLARVLPPTESSLFAVYFQIVTLVSSFGISIAQPLWAAVADANTRSDRAWIMKVIGRARIASLAYGTAAFVGLGVTMNILLRLWLHRTITVSTIDCWLAGLYVLMAMWEYVHWPLTLGLGAMKAASALVLIRALVFAVFVPIASRYGQTGIMMLLSASVIVVSAWSYPRLLSRTVTDAFAQHTN